MLLRGQWGVEGGEQCCLLITPQVLERKLDGMGRVPGVASLALCLAGGQTRGSAKGGDRMREPNGGGRRAAGLDVPWAPLGDFLFQVLETLVEMWTSLTPQEVLMLRSV